MGYTTLYNLFTHNSDWHISEVLSSINSNDLPGLRYAFNKYGDCIDSVKWYNHEEDMRKFSKMYPTITFKLMGQGEGVEDLWHKYFLNGKMQTCHATITFPDYDETKLE